MLTRLLDLKIQQNHMLNTLSERSYSIFVYTYMAELMNHPVVKVFWHSPIFRTSLETKLSTVVFDEMQKL